MTDFDVVNIEELADETGFQLGRIFSIHKVPGGFRFEEECDNYFMQTVTKESAIEVLKTAIKFIERS